MKLILLIPLVYSFSISCLIEYISYKINCPNSRYECPNANCAESLDSFTCCLKSTFSDEMSTLNVTRWESMDLEPNLLGIKQSLSVRTQICKNKELYPEMPSCKDATSKDENNQVSDRNESENSLQVNENQTENPLKSLLFHVNKLKK
ncbi:unnamed protein product [Blepharisma stoltei]|uniref:Uncharacterized protein n=1 Tax=Blepharisma stoltei TaxID=1481888 RepID=A0AAU9IV68_9CILI|nr:unnamed protein product [Blepharisma stoltei]